MIRSLFLALGVPCLQFGQWNDRRQTAGRSQRSALEPIFDHGPTDRYS